MKKSKDDLENIINIIEQGLCELIIEDDETILFVKKLFTLIPEGYILVKWPDFRDFMNQDWFEEEAIYALGPKEKTEGSAFFVPIRRMLEE